MGPASARRSWPASARRSRTTSPRTSTASEQRLRVLDRARGALPGGTFRDLDAARGERPRTDRQDPRHPEKLAVGELHAGRLVAVVPQDLATRLRSDVVESLRDLGHRRVLGGPDRDEVSGVGRDLGRPDDALVVVMRLDDAGDIPPDADAVRAHDDRVGDAVLTQVRGPERVGVLGAELEDVADLDAVPQ